LNAVAVVCITWSVPLGLSASALIYSTAAMGRKRASARCRVSVITGGAGVLAYLVAWIIIPGEGQKSSTAENITGKKQDAWSG
jgi:hypothetical protein